MFVWRSNLLGSSGKGHEYFLKHLLGTTHGVMGKDLGQEGKARPAEAVCTRRRRKESSTCLSRSTSACPRPASTPTSSFPRHLVRKERSQHLGHAPVHPSTDRGGGSRLGGTQRLGDLQSIAKAFSRVAPEVLGVEKDVVLTPIMHDSPGRWRSRLTSRTGSGARSNRSPVRPCPPSPSSNATIQRLQALHFTRTADDKLGNGVKGIAWPTGHEVELLKQLNGVVTPRARPKVWRASRATSTPPKRC